MARHCISAHTLPGTHYPGFVSINHEEDGFVEITLRGEAKADGACGDIVALRIPATSFTQLVGEAHEFNLVTLARKQEA